MQIENKNVVEIRGDKETLLRRTPFLSSILL